MSVGSITTGPMANDLLEKDGLDMVACGRTFQKNPGLGMYFPYPGFHVFG